MTDYKKLCAELLSALESWSPGGGGPLESQEAEKEARLIERARAALADGPAVPEGKNPTRDELWELWLRLNNELPDRPAAVAEFWEHAQINARARARAVRACWGKVAPPADGKVAECAAELEEQKPRPDYDRVQKIATEAQIRSAAQYLAKKQHCDGDLIPAIRYAIARWGHQPAPPADGEVAGLVAEIRHFLAGYQQMRGLDPEHIYSIHRGDKMEAHITVSRLTRAAELLQRLSPPQPVPVGERPWEREGWCDVEGRFWAEHISRSGVASWRCAAASDLGGWAVRCLPAHALPLPEVGE